MGTDVYCYRLIFGWIGCGLVSITRFHCCLQPKTEKPQRLDNFDIEAQGTMAETKPTRRIGGRHKFLTMARDVMTE